MYTGVALLTKAARLGEDAIAHWRKAVEIQDGLSTMSLPPGITRFANCWAELVRSGQGAEGEAVLREGLRKSPRNGTCSSRFLKSLRAPGKDTHEVNKEFHAAWANADRRLSLGVL